MLGRCVTWMVRNVALPCWEGGAGGLDGGSVRLGAMLAGSVEGTLSVYQTMGIDCGYLKAGIHEGELKELSYVDAHIVTRFRPIRPQGYQTSDDL